MTCGVISGVNKCCVNESFGVGFIEDVSGDRALSSGPPVQEGSAL